MSILSENSKKMLVESMRECLSDVLHESTSLTSKQATEKIKFVNESATYEQLLNITMNPLRESKYLPSYVLEGAVAILHSACMTGRKVIGPNAITEGALKLQKKTGAVITESMLDAALAAATEGCGLKVVGKILTEAEGSLAHWDQIIRGLSSGPEKDLLNAEIAALRSGTQSNLSSQAKAILARHTGVDAANIERYLSGNTPQLFRQVQVARNLRSQISTIQRAINDGTATAAQIAQKANLEKRLNTIQGVISGGGSAASGSLKNLANSGAGKTPWGKIALGAVALGGAGALGWKYWQNKKAMQRDMANGTSPY